MSKPIHIGVVGCGYWGPNLIRNFKSHPECELRVVCDLSKDRLAHMKKLYPEVEGLTDYAAMLQDKQLDAVVIATAVRFHHPMAKAALEAGKHTFIEKPMASSVAECEELVELARSKGLTLMVGHTFLYSSPVRKVKEIIQRGDIGDLRYISSRRLNLGLFQKDINVTWDLAPHDLSIILYIMDEWPSQVNCTGNAHVTPGIEDITNMSISFPSGRLATVASSWLDPRKVREMTFVGTRRMIVYDDVQPLEKIRIFDARVERPPHYDTFAEFTYAYHYGDQYIPYVKQEEPLKVETAHFLESIRTGRQPISNGTQGLELVRILESASTSLKKHGAPVALNGHAAAAV
jgi:predicted dehydrogenase